MQAQTTKKKGHITMSNTFKLSQGQGHKLEKAIERNGGNAEDIEWLCKNYNFCNVIRIARSTNDKKHQLSRVVKVDRSIVKVDHSLAPDYFDDKSEVLNPDLEAIGSEKYDLAEMIRWIHYPQGDSTHTLKTIYEHLKDKDMLKDCLSILDAVEILKMDLWSFHTLFNQDGRGYPTVIFWKSVFKDSLGVLMVPFLSDLNRFKIRNISLDLIVGGPSYYDAVYLYPPKS